MKQSHLPGVLLALGAAIIYGAVPNFARLAFLNGVPALETVFYRTTVVAKRELASRPGWGIVTFLAEGHNTAGEEVMRFEGKVLVAA